MGIYKLLYLRNGELMSNFGTVKTFKIYYFIKVNFREIWNRVLRNKYCVIIKKAIVTPTTLGSLNSVPVKDHNYIRGEPRTMTEVWVVREESHTM